MLSALRRSPVERQTKAGRQDEVLQLLGPVSGLGASASPSCGRLGPPHGCFSSVSFITAPELVEAET